MVKNRRTIALHTGKSKRLEKALEAMEDDIAEGRISFNDVADKVREFLVNEYLPIHFYKVDSSSTDFELSAIKSIAFYEAKIKFLKMLMPKQVESLLVKQPLEQPPKVKSGDPEYKVYGDAADGEDESDRFSLSIFDASGSGDEQIG